MDERAFKTLIDYLAKIPAVNSPVDTGCDEEGLWWVKFQIDITSKYAWNVVQELGSVVNYISLNEPLFLVKNTSHCVTMSRFGFARNSIIMT